MDSNGGWSNLSKLLISQPLRKMGRWDSQAVPSPSVKSFVKGINCREVSGDCTKSLDLSSSLRINRKAISHCFLRLLSSIDIEEREEKEDK